MKKTLLFLLMYLFCALSYAEEKLKTKYIYKKDAVAYREIIDEYWDPNKNVTMIIDIKSARGYFLWFFEKELKEEIRDAGTDNAYKVKYHNLYAHLMLHDHGGLVEIAKFQDFGNEVYFPEFEYPYCLVDDADNDGAPEFYLTYFGHSDGLDDKPLKLIIYSINKTVNSKYSKSKATAWYPGGNEDAVYHVEYDVNWKKLPKDVQAKGIKILNKLKEKY